MNKKIRENPKNPRHLRAKNLSDYWLVNREPDLNNLFDLLKLQSAVANFVKIVSGRDILVEFKVNNEKSTIDKIIISADLSNIDATVGWAIHETLSFIYTTKWITAKVVTLVNEDYLIRYQQDKIENLYKTKKRVITEIENIYHLIEYWRLDDFAIRTSPGYKGYITEAYRCFFNPEETIRMFIAETQSQRNLAECLQQRVERNIITEEVRNVQLENKCTYNQLLYALFVQVAHSDYYKAIFKDLKVFKVLKVFKETVIYQIYNQLKSLVDIANISRLKDSEGSLSLAIEIWETVRKAQSLLGTKIQWENGDVKNPHGFEKSESEDLATKVMKAAHLDVDKKAISVSHKEELKLLSSDTSNKNQTYFANRRIKVIVLKDLTRDLVFSGKYTFFETENTYQTENAVIEGLYLGNQLARRISFRNNERQTHFSRLQQGKIDKRLLHSVVCGNDAIFYREKEETFPAVNFHISIDGSHSMHGNCFLKSMKTAVAIAQAGHLIKNINVTISFRYHVLSEGSRLPLVLVAYDSRRDKISKIKQLFPFLKASGSTPEGLCYSVITDLIEKNATENAENYFVNFYDGMPCFILDDTCCYEGKPAIEHVHDEVLRMKRTGIQVLSYFIVSEKWKMEEVKTTFTDCQYMYGKDAKMININDLGELAQSLNNLIAK